MKLTSKNLHRLPVHPYILFILGIRKCAYKWICLKLAKWWDLTFNDLLVVQDLWGRKEARSSVKVTKATYG